jgi:uncharacterized membrane protein YjfL (UPF0719 family)
MYNPFVATIIYAILSLLMMFAGYKFFDMITPFNFNEEIKEKNPAAAVVIAGLFIAIAIIVRASII